tara:strand:- start:1894 stop:2217 length:324 start_codon:yes stop_codon:yes gene_type:complete
MTRLPIGDAAWEPLECPSCHENYSYLHHETVEVFDPAQEDAEEGLHVRVPGEGEQVYIDRNLDGNPSLRRHGLTISFYCETCPARPVLCLVQHKGNTYIYWESHDDV